MSEIEARAKKADLRPISASKVIQGRFRIKVIPEKWDEPPCTRFFPLVPCGLGTCLQESLLSYMDRLARLHAVPIFCFMRRFIYPDVDWNNFELNRLAPDFLVGDIKAIRRAALLAEETSVPEVAQLVQPMLIRNRTSGNANFRTTQAWCHLCFKEWAEEGKPVYRPLLWYLLWCKSCPVHRIYLQNRCPSCSMEFRLLGPRHWSLHCPRCGCSLSQPPAGEEKRLQSSDYDHDCACILAEHLRWSIQFGTFDEPENRFHENLETALDTVGFSELAQITGLNPGLVQQWRNTLHSPELGPLLRLCYCFDLSMHRWLYEQLLPLAFSEVKPKPVVEPVVEKRKPQPRREFERALLFAAVDPTCPPLKSAAARARATPGRVRKNYPTLARFLRDRHAGEKRRLADAEVRERVFAVRKAIDETDTPARCASVRGVVQSLKRRGIPATLEVRAVIQEELGRWAEAYIIDIAEGNYLKRHPEVEPFIRNATILSGDARS